MFGLRFSSAILNILGYFYYDRLIGILFMGFFGSHFELEFYNSDFRIRISDFKLQKSEVPTELLYIFGRGPWGSG